MRYKEFGNTGVRLSVFGFRGAKFLSNMQYGIIDKYMVKYEYYILVQKID